MKRLKSEPKQLFNKNTKHPYSNRVGERAEIMRQFYQAKIYIKEERVTSATGIETCLIENSHTIGFDNPSKENKVSATHGATPSMQQQLTTQTELDDETISLVLMYLRNQYPLRKGFEDAT